MEMHEKVNWFPTIFGVVADDHRAISADVLCLADVK